MGKYSLKEFFVNEDESDANDESMYNRTVNEINTYKANLGDQQFNVVFDVNRNETKKGIKVQFILPKGYSTNQKEDLTQKLKTKLNAGLAPHMLSVDVDLDVPYENVIGFLIRLESFKLFIKNILNPNSDEQTSNTEPTV